MNEKIRTLEKQLNNINSDINPDPMDKINVLNDLSWELRYTDLPRAYQLAQQVQKLLVSHPHPGEQAKCHAALAEIVVRKGDYQQALLLGHAAITLIEQGALDYLRPYVFSTLGIAHWSLGNLTDGLLYFQRQYRTSQQLGDQSNEANALNNIGLIHTDSGDLSSADITFQQALALYETLHDRSGQAMVLNNMTMNLCDAADYSQALDRVLKALELAQDAGDQPLKLAVLDTIGLVYMKQEDYSHARAYFQQTVELANKLGAIASRAISLSRLGQLHAIQSEEDTALSYLHKAQQLLEEIEQKKDLFECHHLLSEIYERRDDLVNALYHYKQYHTVKEQVINKDIDQKLKNLQVNHETETARKEAEIQRIKNVELQTALDHVKQLSGLLPICSNCKKIRDDTGYWHDVASYIRDHSEAEFSHGICPHCVEILYPELIDEPEK